MVANISRWSLIQDGLTYNFFFFFTLQWCKSNTHSIETVLQNLNLIISWASDKWEGTLSGCWTVAASSGPSQEHDQEGNH